MEYQEFLKTKRIINKSTGIDVESINDTLFDFQKDIVRWALKKGKAAIFAMTGLGKTFMQLEWAKHVADYTKGNVLILAPLAVAAQTVREGKKIGIAVHNIRESGAIKEGINIANYDVLHQLDTGRFWGVVLDESSILKSYTGKIRTMIIEKFQSTPFKLACTATPAPNDYVELGNHSEFLGILQGWEMLSMFFINDGDKENKWRLKGHAEKKYWEWVSSWAVMLTKPSDLGYEDDKYNLPPLNMNEIIVKAGSMEGCLVPMQAQTLQERQAARRTTVEQRCQKAAVIANASDKPFLVWCDLNAESELLTKLIPGAVEVKGSDSQEHKEKAMLDFADGKIRVLVSKPSICGYGMNWQHCSDMAFTGLSDSFEQVFQAIRRCYRFGQKNPVNVSIIISELEGAVLQNIKRKESEFERMIEGMIQHTKEITKINIEATSREQKTYQPTQQIILPRWLKGA